MSSTEEDKPLLQADDSKNETQDKFSNQNSLYYGSDQDAISYMEAGYRHKHVRPSLVGSGNYTLSLSWTDICVTVRVPGKRALFGGESRKPSQKMILQHVSGVVAPGSLVAIMGASGSGKSTLLNVLTTRNTKAYVTTGDIRLNGVKVGEGIKNVSAYVQQGDLFVETLTVREQLQFRALLRMDKRFDKKARMDKVEEVIAEMGLIGCSDSRIGAAAGSSKGISGGERKRLSFATEALTNPPIFFCDEPTSSLDSFMAQSIVQTMQKMTNRGRTILCTIHQPSSELFAMFNQLVLLSEGRVAYMGDAKKAMDFFESLKYPCPRNFNPGDHYILTLAIIPGKEYYCRKKANAICDAFRESENNRSLTLESTALIDRDNVDNTLDIMSVTESGSRYESSVWAQTGLLFWRAWNSQHRNTLLFRTRLLQGISIALIIGLVYLQLDINQRGVQNINGAIFLLISNMSFTSLFAVLTSFPEEMPIVMREYGSGIYNLTPYFVTKVAAEIPIFLGITVVFTSVTYWMIGLEEDFETFGIFIIVLNLMATTSGGLGYFMSILTGSTTLALSIAPPVLIPFYLFAGMFMNDDSVADYFLPLKVMSWFKYGYEICMVYEWRDVETIECDGSTLGICIYGNGKDVLDYQNMDEDDLGLDFGVLAGIMSGFYLLAYLALIIKARLSRE